MRRTLRTRVVGLAAALAPVLVGLSATAAPTATAVSTATPAARTPATSSTSATAARANALCVGKQVRRCINVYWNRTNDTYQARATIIDTAGGGNYRVSTNRVKLQWYNPSKGRYVTIRSRGDFDGWHASQDHARTTRIDPCNRKNQAYRARAFFQWEGPSPASHWRTSGAFGHLCD